MITNGVAFFIKILTFFRFLLLYDFNLLIACHRVSLHSIPHSVRLIVDIIDSIAIDFCSSVNDLARPDPLFVVLLRANESLYVINLSKIIDLECIFCVYFLHEYGQSVNRQ